MQRRDLFKLGAVLSASSLLGANIDASEVQTLATSGKKRVIIIGAGFAGLSVAKNIAIQNKECEIFVFESKNIFASCPFSNFWLTNSDISYEQLIRSPFEPANKYGFSIINQKVIDINRKSKFISTENQKYNYDLLVIATGIEYDYGYLFPNKIDAIKCQNSYPASYQGGNEQLILKQKIDNFKEGIFFINVPKNNYKCPPAPYERACLMADNFKRRGLKAKVVLIDPRDKPTTKAKGFLSTFKKHYQDYLEYIPSSIINKIDLDNKKVTFETFNFQTKKFEQKELIFNDANIIPQNIGSHLLKKAGLEVNIEGYARATQVPNFKTTVDNDIYVVGDVLGEYPFPKSAQIATSCGIILGSQIAKRLKNENFNDGEEMPSNVCYSFVNNKEAIAVFHTSSYSKESGIKVVSEFFETADEANAIATKGWFEGIMYNIFE